MDINEDKYISNNISNKPYYSYKKINHLNEWLKRFETKKIVNDLDELDKDSDCDSEIECSDNSSDSEIECSEKYIYEFIKKMREQQEEKEFKEVYDKVKLEIKKDGINTNELKYNTILSYVKKCYNEH
jgi:hypothetical protein